MFCLELSATTKGAAALIKHKQGGCVKIYFEVALDFLDSMSTALTFYISSRHLFGEGLLHSVAKWSLLHQNAQLWRVKSLNT